MTYFKHVFLFFLLLILMSCSSEKRAGSLYEAPVLSAFGITKVHPNLDDSELAKNLLTMEKGEQFYMNEQAIHVTAVYDSALNHECKMFNISPENKFYLFCVDNDKNASFVKVLR